MILLISLLGVGAASSFVGGILGFGGGFLFIPLLTIQLGFDIHTAIFFSLIALFWMSLLQVIQNRDLVERHRKLILNLGFLTIAGSGSAALIGARTPARVLDLIFGTVLIAVSIYFYRDRHWDGANTAASRHGLLAARAVAFAAGILGGLLGIGGGIFNVPSLHKFMKLPIHLASKLSFPFVFISASTALIVAIQTRTAEIRALPLPPVVAVLIGTSLGAHYSHKVKMSSKNLKSLFAIILAILGVIKIYKTL